MAAQEPQARRFPIRLGRRSKPLLFLVFGVRERNSYVDLSATDLYAHFGVFHLRVALSNLARWRIEDGWIWIKAVGVRRGVRDGDISFAGVGDSGLRIDFRQRERRGIVTIPRLYVTVADLDGLAAALSAAGIEGEDARTRGR